MKRVVFVDDEALVLDALRDRLRSRRKQWQMRFVQNAEAALEAVAEAHTDVIVTDVRMPAGGGIELLEQIQAQHPHVVRIVLSGDTVLKTALAALPVAHQWLTKPCPGDVLEAAIERACALRDLLHDPGLQNLLGGTTSLPSAPQVYTRLTQVLADPKACARSVAEVVEKDVAMTAKVLQLANSSFFGPKQRIASLERAIGYLGTMMMRSLVLCVEVFRAFQGANLRPSSLKFMQDHALATAQLAKKLLDDRRVSDEAFTAAVLHDVGKLVLATRVSDQFRAAAQHAQEHGTSMRAAEVECIGFSHAEIGAYLLGVWGLPLSVVEGVAHHLQPGRIEHSRFDVVDAVHVADALMLELKPGPADGFGDSPELDLEHLERLGVGSEQLEQWRELAAQQLERAEEQAA